ncbi:MAG: hypothetical protein AB1757_15470 [Acidobacteriota bacterium]
MKKTAQINSIHRPLRINHKPYGLAGIFILTVLLAGCGKPFNVQPRPRTLAGNYAVTTETGGLKISAEAVTDEDYLYQTFEANLILAGVLPVRLKLENSASQEIKLKDARFEIRANQQTFKLIDGKKAYGRLMDYYGVTVYNKAGFKASREDFIAYGMDIRKSLDSNEIREGLLFFQVPGDTILQNELVLVIRKLSEPKDSEPIELKVK